jgi:hypothetical protein
MMGRRAASFTASDVTRAVKATVAAGLDVDRVEVQPDGTIAVITKGQEAGGNSGLSPLDQWRARKNARPAERS